MEKKAVLFDLDGTLWDASAAVYKTWNRVFERRGLPVRVTQEDITSFMGKTMFQIGELLFPEMEEKARVEIMDDCGKEELVYFTEHGGILYPHLEETMRILAERYFLGIISNCQVGYIPAFMHAHGMEAYFSDYEEADRTGLSKGENIRLVLERNGIGSAFYVGDTAGDKAAAEAAGIPFVYAAYGFGEVSACDNVIDSLSQLPALADKIL